MRKLIIQIPCYNEETTLGVTLSELPRHVPGIDRVEWLVIDDGSTDRTVQVAEDYGVDHIVRLPRHQGLSRAFMAGLEASLKLGADVIVNTDADNQYRAEDIPRLIEPILAGRAHIVVGARPIDQMGHFSPLKKLLQRLGSRITRAISSTSVRDAPSGFRAIGREAAMKLHIFNDYSYTVEMIVQAGQKGMAVVSVPIGTNEDLRPSRLVKSLRGYIGRQVLTMFRIFVTYNPFRFFALTGSVIFLGGFAISLRFLYFYVTEGGRGHVQSLILSALLMGAGFFLVVIGIVVDLISVNRKLLERLDWRLQVVEETLDREAGPARRARARPEDESHRGSATVAAESSTPSDDATRGDA